MATGVSGSAHAASYDPVAGNGIHRHRTAAQAEAAEGFATMRADSLVMNPL
jgi:hypothetical protein